MVAIAKVMDEGYFSSNGEALFCLAVATITGNEIVSRSKNTINQAYIGFFNLLIIKGLPCVPYKVYG
jgi:hypothetical protein